MSAIFLRFRKDSSKFQPRPATVSYIYNNFKDSTCLALD